MLIFVVYDGIANSVFDSQVINPLVRKLEASLTNKILVICFEKVQPSPEVLAALNAIHPNISLIICKKHSFFGRLSLWPAVRSLKKILARFSAYELMARGPLAGYVCLHAVTWSNCSNLTVQARGLLAEEHRYSTRDERNYFLRLINALRLKFFSSLENHVYSHAKITVEAVSPALKTFLIKNLHAHEHKIIIARHDLPQTYSPAAIAGWRTETRKRIGIPESAYVYCFNGSAKPWQCAPETVDFFALRYAENQHTFLLVLSQDKDIFLALLEQRGLPPSSFAIMSVPHKDMYHYLSACDAGLLFRESSIVNWVARPTKLLEYQAVGLEVIHNNTVAWLTENH